MLNAEKTTLSILKKFESPDDYEKRKIVFWYDKDKTANEEGLAYIRSTLAKKGIKLHTLNNNFFETKKLLEKDDTKSSYLIYSPEPEREHIYNWLLDIQLYSSKFENSKISDIKSELNIEGYDLDKFLEANYSFFASKKRVSAFKQFYEKDWRQEDFVQGIFAVLATSSTTDLKEILRKLLISSLEEENNNIWEDIKKYELVDEFWNTIKRHFEYSSDNPTLKKLFLSFIITHIDRNTTVSLSSFKQYINKMSNECEIFIRGWMDHAKDSAIFDNYCHQLLSENRDKLQKDLTSLLNNHEIEEYLEAESIDIFDKNIIHYIVKQLTNDNDNFDKYLNLIDSRKTKHWYSEFKNIYSALENAVKLHQLFRELEHKGINEQSLNELFKTYTTRYYLMDYYYRKFYYYYDRDSEKEILKKDIKVRVENLYNTRLLDTLLTRWSDLINSELEDIWNIELIDSQNKFYNLYVNNILKKNDRDKVAVIISDALRYEVAVELKHVLNKSSKGTIELKSMAGSLPSYTKLGMASLLPHNKLEYKNKHLLVDGIDSQNTANREKILLNSSPNSVALKFRELMDLKRDDAREKIKGKRVIYLYHNKIDETGDKLSSEYEVFNAVESTIRDIDKMINRLSRSLNVTNIIVTSDHGFIYQREHFENVDKLETQDFDKIEIIESDKRFILSEKDVSLLNTHKFKMDTVFNSDKKMFLYVPKADLRFKSQGGGINFVHGGASLQEIVIPVLVYNHNRLESDLDRKGIKYGKVNVSIINSNRLITSSPFKVKLLQTEKVTDKLEPLTCRVALWDMDEDERKVSDEKLIIADSTSEEPEERLYDVILSLSSDIENKRYYLRVIDNDLKAVQKDIFDPIPFEVDILIVDDF